MNDQLIEILWDIEFNVLHEKIFLPSFETTLEEVSQRITEPSYFRKVYTSLLIGIMFIVFCMNYYFIFQKIKKFEFLLNLFPYCDHSDIFHIPQVSQLFFDKFHFKKLHNQRISIDFDIILEKLPEGVILTDHEGTIITINKFVQGILKINSNHLINIPSLFASEQFH
jgi:PAS domain-containing protein